MVKARGRPKDMRKTAIQERAQGTVEAILLGAARILKQAGVASLTTNHIASAAGVSVGSLYQYFPNKEAILVALIRHQLDHDEREMARLVLPHLETSPGSRQSVDTPPTEPESASAQATRRSLAEVMTIVVAQVCSYQHSLAPLLKELLPLLPPLEQTRLVEERLAAMTHSFEALLLAHQAELRPELLEPARRQRALWISSHALRAVLNQALATPELLLEREFQNELSSLCLGYFARRCDGPTKEAT